MHSSLLSQICNQAHSRHCVTAITLVEICLSYICAVTNHQCTAAMFRANHIPDCSVLLLKTGSQQAVSHCNYTYGDLPFIQVCSDQAPVNCSTVQGKMHSPLLSQLCKPGSQQAMCHCSDTSGDLPFIHLCSDQAPMHCGNIQGKSHSRLLSAALENRVTAGTVSLQLHQWRFAFHTFVQ